MTERHWRLALVSGVVALAYSALDSELVTIGNVAAFVAFDVVGLKTHGQPALQRRLLFAVLAAVAAWDGLWLGRGLVEASTVETALAVMLLLLVLGTAYWTWRMTENAMKVAPPEA